MVNRKTKIVATLGPASCSESQLEALIAAGVNIMRLNFSHSTHAEHAETFACVRRVAERMGEPIGVLQDLQGPKIRTGWLVNHQPLELSDHSTLTITTRDVAGADDVVSTTYQNLPKDVHPGDSILIDDGNIELHVLDVRGEDLRMRRIGRRRYLARLRHIIRIEGAG